MIEVAEVSIQICPTTPLVTILKAKKLTFDVFLQMTDGPVQRGTNVCQTVLLSDPFKCHRSSDGAYSFYTSAKDKVCPIHFVRPIRPIFC